MTNHSNNNQIITIKEARKILGKDGVKLSDEEVERLIIDLAGIADGFIKQYTQDDEFRKKVIKYSQDKKRKS